MSLGRADPTVEDLAFVLHGYPYSETSLIVETLTREHGRVALLAKGARRATSRLRGLLAPFQPLTLVWSGKAEIKTLRSAELNQILPAMHGDALIAGFYVSELTLRMSAREDSLAGLFPAYAEVIARLRQGPPAIGGALRCFEKALLRELGYVPDFARAADTGRSVERGRRYWLLPDRGVLAHDPGVPAATATGGLLLDLAAERWTGEAAGPECRDLMRYLINHRLEGRTLHTPQLLRELRTLR